MMIEKITYLPRCILWIIREDKKYFTIPELTDHTFLLPSLEVRTNANITF